MNGEPRPQRADAARNRERVLAAAETVLARDGLSASMRAVAAEAGVGLGTIYRNFPTQEALYQAILVRRTKTLIAEAADLDAAPDPGQAFFGYFARIVEHAMRTRAIADLLARAGIDPKSGMADAGDDMQRAVGTLLARAQKTGAVRPDLRMPELMAILTAACMAAEHSQWDDRLRARTLAIVFDGMRRQHEPGGQRSGHDPEPGPLPHQPDGVPSLAVAAGRRSLPSPSQTSLPQAGGRCRRAAKTRPGPLLFLSGRPGRVLWAEQAYPRSDAFSAMRRSASV